jgi:TolB-like protein
MRSIAILVLVSFLYAIVTPASLLAQAPPKKELIAVLDLDVKGGTSEEAAALSNQLRKELFKTGQFTLVDRSQLDEILKEQALQQSGCTSQECVVQVGRLLGIRQIVSGSVTKISKDLWQVSTVLVDVETSETLRTETINYRGPYEGLLVRGMRNMALTLAGQKVPEDEAPLVFAAPPEEEGFGWFYYTSVTVLTLAAYGLYQAALAEDDKARSRADSNPVSSANEEEKRDEHAQYAYYSAALAAGLIAWGIFSALGDESSADLRGWRLEPIVGAFGEDRTALSLIYRW